MTPSEGCTPHEILSLTERFLIEVVEDLNACPFARRSRQQGLIQYRVIQAGLHDYTSPVFAAYLADTLATAAQSTPLPEAILLIFSLPHEHPLQTPHVLEKLLRQMQAVHHQQVAANVAQSFYAVMFHPSLDISANLRAPSPANLVPALRRAPYPFFQCLRADVMDAVRTKAQHHAEARLQHELHGLGDAAQTLIMAESELSQSIARENFRVLGVNPGRNELQQRTAELCRAAQRAAAPSRNVP